jgi:hypothetical protein
VSQLPVEVRRPLPVRAHRRYRLPTFSRDWWLLGRLALLAFAVALLAAAPAVAVAGGMR